jgi:solute carrier family 35 (UDP-sugar transporter), member A1/2/3
MIDLSFIIQLKILSTAGFAVCFLKRYISSTKWRALSLLVIGCILVASPAYNKPIDCSMELIEAAPEHHTMAESTLGVGAVLVMVTVSGYSSVYFEGMLKKTGEKLTIWERNFQLALYSSFLLIFVVFSEIEDYNIREHQFFTGWTINTVLIAIVQAGGGLLVAATLKYADAVLKTLATSGAIVLSAVLGKMFLGGVLDIFVGLGACGTILAIFNYTLDSTPSPSDNVINSSNNGSNNEDVNNKK